MIFDRFANLKYKYDNRKFWCRAHYVDTIGRNQKKIQEYIRNQLAEDKLADQLTLNELIDPFTGESVKKGWREAPLGAARGRGTGVIPSKPVRAADKSALQAQNKPPA